MDFDPLQELVAQFPDGQLLDGLALGGIACLCNQFVEGLLSLFAVLSAVRKLGALAPDVGNPPAAMKERFHLTWHLGMLPSARMAPAAKASLNARDRTWGLVAPHAVLFREPTGLTKTGKENGQT